MGKAQRAKGHNFERWVARKFKKIFPNARRHLEYHKTDATGVDLVDTGIFRVQCKCSKKYAPITAIKEITLDPIEGGIPLLITKADREEPMVALPLGSFLMLLQGIKHGSWLE